MASDAAGTFLRRKSLEKRRKYIASNEDTCYDQLDMRVKTCIIIQGNSYGKETQLLKECSFLF